MIQIRARCKTSDGRVVTKSVSSKQNETITYSHLVPMHEFIVACLADANYVTVSYKVTPLKAKAKPCVSAISSQSTITSPVVDRALESIIVSVNNAAHNLR